MTKETFFELSNKLLDAGYSEEIGWQRDLKPCSNALDFACEAVWVIINSGMKEQIARKIWERIQDVWQKGGETSTAFKHKGKVKAIDFVWNHKTLLFDNYQKAENKIEYLKSIPFIGNITCFHLAKNLGHDCVKPDRHLVRVANSYNTTPDELCEMLSKETGEKKCVIDIILWRSCNLGLLSCHIGESTRVPKLG